MRLQSFKCNINFQACILPAAGRFGGGRRVPGGRAGAKSHCGLHETALLPSPNGSSFSQPAVMVSASSPFPVRSAELPACDPQTRISPQAVGSWAAAGGAPLAHPAPRPASMGSRPLCSWGITRCWSQTGSPGGDGQHTWTVLSVCILCALGISLPARMLPSDCEPFSQGLLQETLGQGVHWPLRLPDSPSTPVSAPPSKQFRCN